MAETAQGRRTDTKERLMDAAEASILDKGFAATSIEELIAERYPPRCSVDLNHLADMLSGLVDGGIILSKAFRDPSLLPAQVLLYREFVRTICFGTAPEPA